MFSPQPQLTQVNDKHNTTVRRFDSRFVPDTSQSATIPVVQTRLNHYQQKVVERQRLQLQYRTQGYLTTVEQVEGTPSTTELSKREIQPQCHQPQSTDRDLPFLLESLDKDYSFQLTSYNSLDEIGRLEADLGDFNQQDYWTKGAMEVQQQLTGQLPDLMGELEAAHVTSPCRTPPGSNVSTRIPESPRGTKPSPARSLKSPTPSRASRPASAGTPASPCGSQPPSNQSLRSPTPAEDEDDEPKTPPVSAERQRSPSHVSTTPRRSYTGKSIRMDDEPTRINSSDNDSDESDNRTDSEHSNNDQEAEERLDSAEIMSIYKNTNHPRTKDLLTKLDVMTRSDSDLNDDPFKITSDRIRTLAGFSKFVEKKVRAKGVFTKGLKNLFGRDPRPELRTLWNKMSVEESVLLSVPLGLRWLIVQSFLCFGAHDKSQIRTESTKRLKQCVGKMEQQKFSSNYVVETMKSLTKSMEPSRGDTISEDSGAERGTRLADTAASVIGRGATIISSNTVFRSPRTNGTRGRVVSPDGTDSDVSNASVRAIPATAPPKVRRRRNDRNVGGAPSSRALPTTASQKRVKGTESDVSTVSSAIAVPARDTDSDVSGVSSVRATLTTTSPKRRRYTASKTKAVTTGKAPTVGQSTMEDENFIPFNKLFPEFPEWPEHAAVNPSSLLVEVRVYERLFQNPGQILMSRLEPNSHVTAATKQVVLDILDSVYEEPRKTLDFGQILRGLVKHITTAVMDHPSSNQQEILGYLSKVRTKRDRDAITFCLGVLQLIHERISPLVKVPWNVLKDWCGRYVLCLNRAILKTSEKLQREKKTVSNDLENEFVAFREGLEGELTESFPNLLKVFSNLSNVSDVCLYVLFGTSIYRHESGDTIYTDSIVKNVMLAWMRADRSPADFTKEDNDKMTKIFWCLPLAFLTKMRGIGSYGTGRASPEPSTCTYKRYFRIGKGDSENEDD